MMNETRFMELLAAYGAELSRWPEAERDAAAALLESAPHRVKDVWESERMFDGLLVLEADAPASIALEKRLIAAAPARRPHKAPWMRVRRWSMRQWAAGGALAASLALGFAVGYAAEPEPTTGADYAQILALSGTGASSIFLAAIEDSGN